MGRTQYLHPAVIKQEITGHWLGGGRGPAQDTGTLDTHNPPLAQCLQETKVNKALPRDSTVS